VATSRFHAVGLNEVMRALSIQFLIVARLLANDGIFLEKRRMPYAPVHGR